MQGSIDEAELTRRLIGNDSSRSKLNIYCQLLGIPIDEFLARASYSYWKHLGGSNLTIIRDSAVKERFHVFAVEPRTSGRAYFRTDEGKITDHRSFKIVIDPLVAGLRHFIDFYETIRTLDRFDPNHCPVIECQFVDGALFFLQYHRTRDFAEATFELDRPPGEDEFEASFVRGATPPEGIEVAVNICFPLMRLSDVQLPPHEPAAIDLSSNNILQEIMSRRRGHQIINSSDHFNFVLDAAIGHVSRSIFFKPGLSFVANLDAFLTRDFFRHRICTGENPPVPIRLVSDGRRAYLRFL